MGFTSLIVQGLLIREFLITFYGNELTIGIILACWIISEALGSGVASRIGNRVKSPLASYALLQTLISVYLPLSIFLIRGVKDSLAVIPGEAVGIVPVFMSCVFIIGPLSIFDGMQFPFGCRIYGAYSKKIEQTAGKVYILEAAGFILAGPIFTYLLLGRLNSFQIVFLIGLINLLSAISLSFPLRRRGIIILILILLNSYLLFSNTALQFHKYSLSRQWRNQKLISYKNSIYGNLAVTQKEEQFTFYSNGIPIINIPAPDIIRTEEFIHFGLLSYSDTPNTPRRCVKVLFLGGGAGGMINEVLKHPNAMVDYAELDPVLIKLLREFPKDITKKEFGSPRVNLIIKDGVRFVKTTDARYDIIFINLPFPSTLQLNRYYTKEFFGQLKKMISPNGQLVLTLPGSLSYLNEELRQLNLCIFTTLKHVFGHTAVIPGDSNLYISSMAPLEITPRLFMERLKERNIQTKTLDQFHIEDRLRKYWQDWFYNTIEKLEVKVEENKNLTPAGVFYGISYWNSLFNPQLRGFFKTLGQLRLNHAIFLILILLLIVIASELLRAKQSQKGIAFSIATTGFAGMSLNLIFIFSYQAFFGYVYHHIALLVTSFMLGLTLGGWLITKNLERIKRGLFLFITMEGAIILFSLGCGLLLTCLNKAEQFSFYPVFYLLSIITGFLVGSEFPLANRLCRQEGSVGKTAGTLYALDLLGAFFSAVLVSIVLLPIFGVLKTCLFLALLKLGGIILYFKCFLGGRH